MTSLTQPTLAPIRETEINLIASNTQLEGEVFFDSQTRIHGSIKGTVHGLAGSQLIIAKEAKVSGKILCHDLIIDGFVEGEIQASGKLKITSSGRVFGGISANKLEIEAGAIFEGTTSRHLS